MKMCLAGPLILLATSTVNAQSSDIDTAVDEAMARDAVERVEADRTTYDQRDICRLLDHAYPRLAGKDDPELSGVPDAIQHLIFDRTRIDRNVAFEQDGLKVSGGWGRCTLQPSDGLRINFETIRLSSSGDLAAIDGGWAVPGELMGAGGMCLYRRATEDWTPLGCFRTWVS